jgi:hypothetical protein
VYGEAVLRSSLSCSTQPRSTQHQAKDLLHAVKQGDPAAIGELRKHHP